LHLFLNEEKAIVNDASVPHEKDAQGGSRQVDLQAKWHAVVESLVHALIVIDDRGIIQEVNPATLELFGYDEGEMVGQNVSMLMPEPYRHEHDSYLARYKKTGEKRIIGIGREVLAMRKDGKTFPVLLSVGEALDGGPRSFFFGVIYDLTEAKQNEERLVDAQKTEAVTQLTAGIAHDFNNMLTVIQGNLEMLDAHVADRDGRELLSEVLGAIEDGGRLVKQLLAFSRKQTLDPRVIDLNQLVAGLLKLLRRTISENIEIRDILGAGMTPVEVDPQQLENAILNLVINARDAMPGGGRISIETDMVDADNVMPGADIHPSTDRYARITIRDSGPGIPEDIMSRIFEPFFSTKAPGKGSGLGLSMAQGFTRQSGGDLLLETIPGQGTTLSILLPGLTSVQPTSRRPQFETDPNAPVRGGKETILLVEDDARVRRANTRRLVALGYRVLEAADGPTALDILLKHDNVEVLFSDIIMPGGMLGNELAEKARLMRPKLKILLTTGYAEDAVSGRGSPFDLLSKPFRGKQLAAKVRTLLDN